MKKCAKCNTDFKITNQDLAFYHKIDVPEPTFCHQCRNQRRMSFRNERHLHQRNCDLCHKSFLSIYEADQTFPVYCYDCWWSDKWDALNFGQEYDSNRSFFEQAKELFDKIPHLGVVTAHCENSEYANYTNYSKNCYLIFGCHAAEDCYYGWRVHDSLQCTDCLQIDKSKYCYDCVDCDECYSLFFSQDCNHCSNSAFLYDCKGCQDCLFSAGLRNKQYCIFNKQYSKEAYEQEKKKLDLGSYHSLLIAREKFQKLLQDYPRCATFIINCESVTGDHIINSKNVTLGFNVKNVYDGAYLESCEDIKDSLDCTFSGWPAELSYECISAGVNAYSNKFSESSWSCANIEYCNSCHHSKELFGCFGLRHKNEYCILNKQYEPAEYLRLKQKIVSNMKSQKEYGEYFPSSSSPYAYNETVAHDFYPLNKEEALSKGFMWKDKNPKEYLPQNYDIPDHIRNVPDSITKEILSCQHCRRNYKLITQEFKFCQKFNLPIPRLCFDCRHQSRMQQRNPRQLWNRKCTKCNNPIQTNYAPERPEKIYCEKCYLLEVY